jgi:hypothetical protein
VASPYSQRQVTAAELAVEHESKLRQLEAEYQAESAEVDAKAAQAQREFDAAIARLDLTNQQALIDLRAQFDAKADVIVGLRASQQRQQAIEAQILADKLAKGQGDLLRKQEQASFVNALLGSAANDPTVNAAISSVPVVGGLLAGLFGVVRGNVNARRAREDEAAKAKTLREVEHATWEEAKRDAESAQAKADKAWEDSQAAARLDGLQAAILQLTAKLTPPAVEPVKTA